MTIHSQELPGQEFVINWFRMGGVVLNAADVWATIALRNYEAKLLEIQANFANNSSEADLADLRTQARQLEVDLKRKENAKIEAIELRNNSHQLAQRTVMMLTALQDKVSSCTRINRNTYIRTHPRTCTSKHSVFLTLMHLTFPSCLHCVL